MVDLQEHLSETLLGGGNMTGGKHPDMLIRQNHGSLVIVEANGCGGTRRYVCANCFDGAEIVGLADVIGDGYTGVIALSPRGEVLAFPHTGVFWPQDPATTFGYPIVLG